MFLPTQTQDAAGHINWQHLADLSVGTCFKLGATKRAFFLLLLNLSLLIREGKCAHVLGEIEYS